MAQSAHVYMYVYAVYKCAHIISQCNGKPILWSHVEELYKEDTRSDLAATGLHLVPKLKYEHIYLTSFSKMRVDLAAQVGTVHTNSPS